MRRRTPPPVSAKPAPLLSRRGVVLIAVLLVSVLLALAAYHYTDSMTSEFKASENAVRQAQVKAAAESGVHYVAALLADPTTFAALNGNLWDNPDQFRDISVRQDDNGRYSAKFSVVSPPYDPSNTGTGTGPRFGVMDEGSKINPNALMVLDPTGNTLYKLLMKLPNMTSDIACAIIDWIDADDNPYSAPDGSGSTGAESNYYTGLNPPYKCKNAPLDSLEELLLVRGVTPQLLFGSDKNRNGIQDADEYSADGSFDPGWASYLTLYSKEMNVDSTGNPRLALTGVTDFTTFYSNLTAAINDGDMAKYIILYMNNGPATPPATSSTTTGGGNTNTGGKGGGSTSTQQNYVLATDLSGVQDSDLNLANTTSVKNQISSIYSLVNTYVMVQSSDPKGKPTYYPCPLNDAGKLAILLPVLLDKTTTTTDQQLVGRININTAKQAVLTCLEALAPEITDDTINQLMQMRPSLDNSYQQDDTFNTAAWLVIKGGISPTTMAKLDKYITTTTQVYRFQVLAYFDEGGMTCRIEAVVDTNNGNPRILYQRDITELGKGFDLSTQQ
jgi:type II secretory pathway component PulK